MSIRQASLQRAACASIAVWLGAAAAAAAIRQFIDY